MRWNSPGVRSVSRVGRGRGEEADRERLLQQLPPVVAEDRHTGREDHPVGVEDAAFRPVVLVELGHAQQRGVQGGRPAECFLLGLRPVEVTAAGVAGGGEVQDGDRSLLGAGEPAGGLGAALARDLEAGDPVRVR
jgi:hypothetical protein